MRRRARGHYPRGHHHHESATQAHQTPFCLVHAPSAERQVWRAERRGRAHQRVPSGAERKPYTECMTDASEIVGIGGAKRELAVNAKGALGDASQLLIAWVSRSRVVQRSLSLCGRGSRTERSELGERPAHGQVATVLWTCATRPVASYGRHEHLPHAVEQDRREPGE